MENRLLIVRDLLTCLVSPGPVVLCVPDLPEIWLIFMVMSCKMNETDASVWVSLWVNFTICICQGIQICTSKFLKYSCSNWLPLPECQGMAWPIPGEFVHLARRDEFGNPLKSWVFLVWGEGCANKSVPPLVCPYLHIFILNKIPVYLILLSIRVTSHWNVDLEASGAW